MKASPWFPLFILPLVLVTSCGDESASIAAEMAAMEGRTEVALHTQERLERQLEERVEEHQRRILELERSHRKQLRELEEQVRAQTESVRKLSAELDQARLKAIAAEQAREEERSKLTRLELRAGLQHSLQELCRLENRYLAREEAERKAREEQARLETLAREQRELEQLAAQQEARELAARHDRILREMEDRLQDEFVQRRGAEEALRHQPRNQIYVFPQPVPERRLHTKPSTLPGAGKGTR